MDHSLGVSNSHASASQSEYNHQTCDRQTSHPARVNLVEQLQSCLALLRTLIDDMVQTSKDSSFASGYVIPTGHRLDDELIQLEHWASEIGADDPNFVHVPVDKAESDLNGTKLITERLAQVSHHLGLVDVEVNEIRLLLVELSGRWMKDL